MGSTRLGLCFFFALAPLAVVWLSQAAAPLPGATATARTEVMPVSVLQSILLRPATPQYPRNSEGDIALLRDGRLLLVWSRFYGGGADDAAAEIAARVSEDGGLTWGAPFVVQHNDGAFNVMSASLVRGGNRDLLLFFLRKNADDDLKAVVRRSPDEGETWSAETVVTREPGYHVMNNARVVRLRSGRLLAPVASSLDCSGREHYRSVCYLSGDDGFTWRRGAGEVDLERRGAMEPGLVELKDGRVLMIIRTQLSAIHRSYSSDGGDTWSAPEPSGVAAPEAPSTIARIPSTGDLLLVWNNNADMSAGHSGRRTPLSTAVSRNEGLTWEHVRNLETDPNHTYAYTSVTFFDETVILSYYDQDSSGLGLRVTRAPIRWLYEG